MKRNLMDRKLAWAAATDAGNRSARAGGRVAWNEDDKRAACAEFRRLWPESRDCECKEGKGGAS